MAITALPTPPSRQDPTNFALRADSFLGALPAFAAEANALVTQVNTLALNANSSAVSAVTSATNASNSANSAAASAANAANSYDAFDDRYLGSKASNPTADNDGQTLLTGAMHWNTSAADMRVWTGSGWVSVQTTTASASASTSAINASNSASAAATSANNAATSASNAATSATNASNSATAAANSYDAFDDRYLGSKSSNPTTDNDGQALLTGAMYWNTSAGEMRVWTGSAWAPVQTTSSATSAATSATNAANSAITAGNFADSAANSWDAFDDRYLGSKSGNPTVDNDGQALLVGAMHWNTSAGEMRVWSGSAWVPVQTTTASANAATSAANALAYSNSATISATSSANSANAASSSSNNASVYASNASGTLVDFRDRYLGSRSATPTVATSGAALQKGMLYFDTGTNEMRVYSGTVWSAPAAPASNIQVSPINTGGSSSLTYPLLVSNYGTSVATQVHAGTLTYNGVTGTLNATHFNNLSDISLKTNVLDLTNSITTLKALSPKSFTWKSSGIKDYGLIAQEVESVLPELVETSANGIKSVSYISIIALLLNAVVELDNEVKLLKVK